MTDRERVDRLHHLISGLAAQCLRWSEINGRWAEPHRIVSDAAHSVEAIRLVIERGDGEAVRHFAAMAEERVDAAARAIRGLDPETADSLRAERRLLDGLRGYRGHGETDGESGIPGFDRVLDVLKDRELAWVFLTEEQPLADEVARPIDKLKRGEIEEVVGAALSFGSAPT